MSGLLSGILTVVGIAGAIASGGTLGIVAGALLAASYASQKGWLGGGMKNFFNSGIGQGLTMAVGLASAAAGAYTALNSGAQAAQTAENASMASQALSGAGANSVTSGFDAANAASTASPGLDPAAPTVGGFSAQNASDSTAFVASNQDQSLLSGGNMTLQQMNSANSSYDSNFTLNSTPGVTPEQAQANMGTGSPVDSITNPNSGQNIPLPSQTGSGTSAINPSSQGSATQTAIDQAGGPVPASASGAPAASTGLLDKAGNALSSVGGYLNKNPSVALMGGQALAGLGQGLEQQKAIQEQIAAQQWGNYQWMQPGQVANMQAAAAAPITVPSGYLSRAQAVANLANGRTQSNGPVMGPQPTPTTPTQVTAPQGGGGVAPVGMGGSPTGSGPVPVVGMNAATRGGMP